LLVWAASNTAANSHCNTLLLLLLLLLYALIAKQTVVVVARYSEWHSLGAQAAPLTPPLLLALLYGGDVPLCDEVVKLLLPFLELPLLLLLLLSGGWGDTHDSMLRSSALRRRRCAAAWLCMRQCI
jgi:hypothetical protein